MAKHIQIRNVPEPVHRTMKARAAEAGMSLSDYLLMEIRDTASRPTLEELIRRINSRGRVRLKTSPVAIIRRMRDAE